MNPLKLSLMILARNWPLASERQAKRQAVRLIRARQYLRQRGIEAHAVNSSFAYKSAPQVLS